MKCGIILVYLFDTSNIVFFTINAKNNNVKL